jgi:hypothetical protein
MYLRSQKINKIHAENERGKQSQTDTTPGHNKTMKLSLVPRLFISHIVWIFLGFIKLNTHKKEDIGFLQI